MLFRTLILKFSDLGFIKKFMRESRLVKPLITRFIAGETLEEAITAAEDLAEKGFHSSLDLLGENVATVEEANQATQAYKEVIERIATSPHKEKINISIKLTALGFDQGDDIAEANYRTLLKAAAEHNIFIRADMEGSPYTERTIDLVEKVHQDFPRLTGTVIQAYLYRSPQDIERLLAQGIRMRWVKGAYLEDPKIAIPEKPGVDAVYLDYAKVLLVRAFYPAIASQDQKIIEELKTFIKSEKIDPKSFEWQMLYGIRRDLQKQLIEEGFNLRVYIPYGAAWYPYFSRRLAERPANVFFIAKSLIQK